MAKKVLIMGAGGKDFHTFNCLFRDKPEYQVVGFTATQIPGIDKRRFPPEIAGSLYPEGLPILPEKELANIIEKESVDIVVFAYSDVSYDYIQKHRTTVEALGVEFMTPIPRSTMIPSQKPVIAVCAIRTGAGKSAVSRSVVKILAEKGKRVIVIRHPMPYGDLYKQEVQRFENIEDLAKHECTIEEMEEYEPHIRNGGVVYAGVDYGKILVEAEKEADVILWDGGNNDTSFYKPDLYITILDPLRAGHELLYYPGRENFELADVLLINKVDQASESDIKTIEKNIAEHNPSATVIKGNLEVSVDRASEITGKRVLVVEDGPTLTHGGMKYGAGVVAAKRNGAKELINPRSFVKGEVKRTFDQYPGIGNLLPAVGYSAEQIKDLEDAINDSDAELVIIATPIDLGRVIKISKPFVTVKYDYVDIGTPSLSSVLDSI